MSKGPCIGRVAALLGQVGVEGITDVALGRLYNQAFGEAAARGITDVVARESFVADRVFDEVIANVATKRDVKVQTDERVAELSTAIARHHSAGGRLDKAIKGLLTGSLQGKDSVGNAQGARAQEALGELDVALNRAKVFEAYVNADEAFTREIYSGKKDVSKDALAIRSILQEMETRRLVRIQQSGLDTTPLPNRISRQVHDPYIMMGARKAYDGGSNYTSDMEAWVEYTFPRLDPKTYADWQDDPRAILALMYQDFVVGRNNVVLDSGVGKELPVDNALTASRKLHFTPDGEVDYMLTFGAGSLAETVANEISHYSRSIALVDILGPQPHETLVRTVREVRSMHPNDRKLEAYVRGFDAGQLNTPIGRDWSEVSGRNNMVVGTVKHEVSSWIQTFIFMTKMGQSALAAGMDIPGMAAEFNFQSGNAIGSLARALGAPIEGITAKGAQRQVADALAIGMEGMLNEHYTRLGGNISPSKYRTKLMNLTFKANLLGPWTNSVRRGFYMSMSRFMATGILEANFTDRMLALAKTYNIRKSDLGILKEHLDFGTEGGPDMFDPTRIRDIPIEAFGGDLVARNVLQRRMTQFMLDRMNQGVFTPDADTRSIVHRGLPKGDPLRVLLDLFFQLKQYPIGFVRGPMANSAMGPGQTYKSGAMSLGTHIAFLLPFGAAVNHLKDMAKGREQFYPETKKESLLYFTNAFIQSGAGGLYGDFLIGQTKGLPETLVRMAGPAANDALDYYEVLEALVTGDDVGPKAFQAIRNDLPLADLFWVKTPLDYAIMYGLAEQMDPGFARSYEKRVQSQRMGRGLIFSPSQYALGVD